ncbi:hypothetical protein FOPG_07797 [Fusarium oxysporum f. sp. conglutinans race 2 54008]|uniref:Integral membrane protein n=3 Tax=Fusarium oxysporum f. sp. conglutinans TaxID=100902 RepID=A0A8H6LIZ7_FUSOX|nr:hypothetical protein FOXB_07596 [Fusarium oxysporum f. sp. conglutinans Fo5176]EXL77888.1 hypothetical protein FOPG_07797 [Fusarium oxysporum f. sp. conglutinans race 2 54008]KAF6522467.1 hypothetical protein HZS61_013995 [Fusarium oxysporum f. sp. conglutinans]KAG6987478.1 Filamentous hemagglutinin [Fusarium oxysporum f. sp. conglutinans]
MAWLKDFVGKVGEEYKKQVQLQQQQQQQQQQRQRESGYYGQGTSRGYQQGEYQRGSPPGWQQQYQAGQPQYQQPQTQYQPQSPQYGQPQTPQYQPQQQQYPPLPSPYRPSSARPSQTSSQPHITPPATQPAPQTCPQSSYPPQAHTQQLETQWREAERLAAHYKAEYEAQMRKATEDLANMRIEQEKQAQELEKLRAEEARNYQLAEDEVVREQQRLFDEIQRQRQEGERPPLPPRINTDVEDVAPPLPRRPVSTAGSVSSAQRPVSYAAPPAQNSYRSPQSQTQVPSSPSMGYIPPPPPGPPPAQATTPIQPQSGGYLSPAVVPPGQASQQTPYYPPPPPSPQAQPSPKVQEQASQRNSYHTPAPESPQPQQANIPSYPPPPPVQSPQQQPIAAPKPPRVRTPEPAQLHACGAKAGLECSGSLTSFPQHWFYHAAVPEFVICARCYVDLIYDTKFRDSFRKVFYDDGHKRRCRFNTRRIKDTLLPEAVESGSLDKLIEFMRKRMSIKDCREQNTTEGESWYKAADIPNGTICEACFEDGLITSSFAKYYQLLPNEGGAYCDLSVWFLKRKFIDYAKENKWAQFCQEFNQRAQIPECPKIDTINANERAWYRPENGPSDLQACAACYHDYFYASEDQDKWQQVTGGNFQTRCILGQLNHIIPMHQALDDEDRSLFWNAAWEMDKYPVCNRDGTKGSSWYTPINDPPGWGICAACYEGIIKPIGGARWFMKDNSTKPDELYLCGFSLGHPRAVQALEAYVSARNWGDRKLFLDWTAQLGHVQQCPRKNFSKNRRWWGWGVLEICEDCYASFAKGTALEPRFALTGVREPEKERMCDIYSPRMRSLYTEACRTGDLEGLLAVAEQRHVVYTQTIMQCEQILNQQKIAAMQAQMLGTQGTFYKSMGWAQDATMGHSYTVGNSYAGYGHANEWVMQGYSYDRQSREAAAEVMGGGPLMRIQMLEARWREVE